jgi:hypothetical protein
MPVWYVRQSPASPMFFALAGSLGCAKQHLHADASAPAKTAYGSRFRMAGRVWSGPAGHCTPSPHTSRPRYVLVFTHRGHARQCSPEPPRTFRHQLHFAGEQFLILLLSIEMSAIRDAPSMPRARCHACGLERSSNSPLPSAAAVAVVLLLFVLAVGVVGGWWRREHMHLITSLRNVLYVQYKSPKPPSQHVVLLGRPTRATVYKTCREGE